MADIENGIEMLNRNGNRVGRIGDLADKAAVLAHGMREPDAACRTGRLSSTSLKMRLYSATALSFARLHRVPLQSRMPPLLSPLDGLLDLSKRRRIDRQLAQAARAGARDTTRIAGHVAAQS